MLRDTYNANTEALLAVRVTILYEVIADFFVSECFISLVEMY